jgi:hypothetical protein
MWLSTGAVARRLKVGPRWVRWLATAGELACEHVETASGEDERIYRRDAVNRLLIQRTDAEGRPRAELLRAVRVRMLKAGYEPRQLAFWHGLGLRIVRRGERSDPHAEVKRARSGVFQGGSEKQPYVDRKAARR